MFKSILPLFFGLNFSIKGLSDGFLYVEDSSTQKYLIFTQERKTFCYV